MANVKGFTTCPVPPGNIRRSCPLIRTVKFAVISRDSSHIGGDLYLIGHYCIEGLTFERSHSLVIELT